jgi:hypothetical protein
LPGLEVFGTFLNPALVSTGFGTDYSRPVGTINANYKGNSELRFYRVGVAGGKGPLEKGAKTRKRLRCGRRQPCDLKLFE